jgi:hypothetical protein
MGINLGSFNTAVNCISCIASKGKLRKFIKNEWYAANTMMALVWRDQQKSQNQSGLPAEIQIRNPLNIKECKPHQKIWFV